MAQIEFRIDKDDTGKVVIAARVLRLDPGDEIHLATDTPNAALQFNGESPFLAPDTAKVYMLPGVDAPRRALKPAKAIDMSLSLALCGVSFGDGQFAAWSTGAGFPDPGNFQS